MLYAQVSSICLQGIMKTEQTNNETKQIKKQNKTETNN